MGQYATRKLGAVRAGLALSGQPATMGVRGGRYFRGKAEILKAES
jgi:hypothetical protein